MKLTPDQLHRLIDEVAALAYLDEYRARSIADACYQLDYETFCWWTCRGFAVFDRAGGGFAGLSAVLILLSEGG